MILALRAQDIDLFEAAIDDHGRSVSASLSVPPERFLASLQECMDQWGASWKLLERVVVVTGPGSFTSTRMIVTMANAIAFAGNIPVSELPNPDRLSLADLMHDGAWATALSDVPFASPLYDRPPNITKRRDASLGDKWLDS